MGTGQARLADAAVGHLLSNPRIDSAEEQQHLLTALRTILPVRKAAEDEVLGKKARHSTDSASRLK
jgi:hypothetical protein